MASLRKRIEELHARLGYEDCYFDKNVQFDDRIKDLIIIHPFYWLGERVMDKIRSYETGINEMARYLRKD